MVYCIDIDNTICQTYGTEYSKSKPFLSRIKIINKLYSDGHEIILETGRHWRYLQLTLESLKKWKIKYNTLIMGRVPADVFINDKNIDLKKFFKE